MKVQHEQVVALLKTDLSYAQIGARLGINSATVSHHAARAGLSRGGNQHRLIDWPAIQAYYDEPHSGRATILHFGIARATFDLAIKRGRLIKRPTVVMPDDVLHSRGAARNRFLRSGTPYQCAICGIAEWLGEPLSLHLDHINGRGLDHRTENLRWLCPNCHSQTDTYAGRNKR